MKANEVKIATQTAFSQLIAQRRKEDSRLLVFDIICSALLTASVVYGSDAPVSGSTALWFVGFLISCLFVTFVLRDV